MGAEEDVTGYIREGYAFSPMYTLGLRKMMKDGGGAALMAQSGKGRLNYRCPSCFMRDLDIDMFYDKDKEEYYCIRCQYTGSEEDVLEKNEMARFRYRRMLDRITNFDDE